MSYFRFGPLVYHWTMRYEAKHSYFKSLTHTLGNYVNIPYSLAMRYQHVCYTQSITQDCQKDHITTGPGGRTYSYMITCKCILKNEPTMYMYIAFPVATTELPDTISAFNAGVAEAIFHWSGKTFCHKIHYL